MDKNAVDRLIKAGVKASNDNKNPQQRQVIATAGKLRIQVSKGADRGKTSS
tara:strand:- start:613 stop:765 length:153 start_codon:yes stop_codon:yes gene_type:complete